MTDKGTESGRTELDSLGEFGLIEHLTKSIALRQPTSKMGVGDDAAVIDLGTGELLLLTSDMLLEGIHFDLTYTPLQHLGYKAVAVNVSDIAAMNGRCQQIIVNLALSNRFSLEAVETLYQGIYSACDHYGVDLVGGDTNSSHSGLVLSVTALGRVSADKLVTRAGAGENHLICVSGDLGAAYLGLQVLEREKQVYLANKDMQPDLEPYEYVVKRQLRPEARADVIQWMAQTGLVPSAMIDLSDGLASDLLHICHRSGVGARIYQDKLPIDPATVDAALEFKLDPTTCGLNGGEDYELLFTVAQDHYKTVASRDGLHIIGHISQKSSGAELVLKSGETTPLVAQGWRHF